MKLAAMGSAMGPGRRALGLLLAVTGAANGLSALGRAASTTARASPIRMMPIGVPKVLAARSLSAAAAPSLV